MASKSRVRDAGLPDADLLWLFVDLVGEYDRLCAAFPVSVGAAELFDHQIPDVERWHRIVRTLAVRKFVIGEQDASRVDRVVQAFQNCLIEDDPATDEFVEEFLSITTKHEDDLKVFEDILYGELLHCEYARHLRNRARPQQQTDVAVWKIGEAAEFLVRNVRTSILVAAREQRLNSEATASLNRGDHREMPIV